MLIEVKARVSRIEGGKSRKRTETYLIEKEFFSEAEYAVMSLLSEEKSSGIVECSEILSLRQSPVKEIDEQSFSDGKSSFLATLKDIFLADDGMEKPIKYKILLWADDLTKANERTLELSRQGYNMEVVGIKQVDHIYLK